MSDIIKMATVNVPGIYNNFSSPLDYMTEFAKKRIVARYKEIVKVFNSAFGRSSACAVCIDYMPLSIFSTSQNNVRQLYGSIVSDQGTLSVTFRTRPAYKLTNKETPLAGVLSKFIFNYETVKSILSFISANQNNFSEDNLKKLFDETIAFALITLKLEDYYIRKSEYSFISQIGNDRQFEKGCMARNSIFLYCTYIRDICASANRNGKLSNDNIEVIADYLKKIQAGIESLSDSVYDLVIYTSIAESQELYALLALCGTKDDLADCLDNMFSGVHYIKDIGAITLNTLHLFILEQLQKIDGSSMCEIVNDPKNDPPHQAVRDMLGIYCTDGGKELLKLYDRHMFVANYELMHLNRSSTYAPKNIQGIYNRFTEYVPLMIKFGQVYNPLFDKKSEDKPIYEYLFSTAESLREDLLCLTISSSNDLVLRRYEDYLRDTNKDDQNNAERLYSIMLPCDYFDSLANKYFILPAFKNVIEDMITDKNMTLPFSAYMSETLVTSWLQNLGIIFDRADSVMSSSMAVGKYYFSEEQGQGTSIHVPRVIQMLHEFGTSVSTPLTEYDHYTDIGYFDILLYKILLAANKKPLGIDIVRSDLDFNSWVATNINSFGGTLND